MTEQTEKTYAWSVVQNTLGLPRGPEPPDDLLGPIAMDLNSVVTGNEPKTTDEPFLDLEIQRVGSELEKAALDAREFFVAKEPWPDAASFAVCLTHDVDNIERPASHLLQRSGRFSKSDLLLALLQVRSVYNNIELVSRVEAERGLRSSFFFLTSNYPLGKVADVVGLLRRNGWDVGLHGDHGTHDSAENLHHAIERFAKGLGFSPAGIREHFLQFDFDKTWGLLEAEHFDYDATVGLRDKLGFRLGIATPFHPPGKDWKPLNLLELPLTLMDTTLWGYLKMNEDTGFAAYRNLLNQVKGAKGLFTILWHQEAVRMRGGRLYPRILDDLSGEACYVASGQEIARWWREREVPLVVEGNVVRLGGRPPKGLTLRLITKSERTLRVEGGSVERTGNAAMVKVESEGFRMEIP